MITLASLGSGSVNVNNPTSGIVHLFFTFSIFSRHGFFLPAGNLAMLENISMGQYSLSLRASQMRPSGMALPSSELPKMYEASARPMSLTVIFPVATTAIAVEYKLSSKAFSMLARKASS
jgi:hypothetical protein